MAAGSQRCWSGEGSGGGGRRLRVVPARHRPLALQALVSEMEKEPLDMVESSVRVMQTHVDIIRSLVTDGVVDSSEPQCVYTLKTTLFQIGEVCDMLEKCALSIKKYADSKREQILEDEAQKYAEDIEAANDVVSLPSLEHITQADVLDKYFGIEYDSDQSWGC